MLRARSFIIAIGCLSFASACNLLRPATADAQTISLSLNVVYSNSANSNSGGSWSLTAKTSDFGLSGLQAHIMNITNVFDVSPYGIVNNTDPAGFYQGDFFFFVPPDGATPGYYELNFGQSPIFTPGHEQGAFYGVGQLANGSPNYSGKPAGSNSEGPTLSTLAQTFGIPWATGDVFGDPTWSTGALLAAGSFATGTTPAFFSNNNGNVFKTLGTSTAFGTVGAATVSTIVRTNLVSITADYNHNGVVDMADYVLWRDTLNQNVTAGSGADGSGNGVIDQADYSVWRANFGNHAGSGSGSGSLSTSTVPEPFSAVLFAIGAMVVYCGIRPRRLCPAVVVSGYSIRHSR